jgi:hypothetical protein
LSARPAGPATVVRTSKGPAEKSKAKTATHSPADAEKTLRPADLDDATWDQIQSLARSQGTTTTAVIKRAIVNQFGAASPTGAYHSGMENDPSKA